MASYGITLLDVVIIHDDHRWWSLHELTSGTTEWTIGELGSGCVDLDT